LDFDRAASVDRGSTSEIVSKKINIGTILKLELDIIPFCFLFNSFLLQQSEMKRPYLSTPFDITLMSSEMPHPFYLSSGLCANHQSIESHCQFHESEPGLFSQRHALHASDSRDCLEYSTSCLSAM
jgi:hypothetical protein